jgi:peroxiredoxin Q/BCP
MYGDHTDTLQFGSRAPDFDLPTADGTRVSLAPLQGQTVLVFFLRGTWCPNCKKLMKRLDSDWKEFEERDVRVLCIAAQRINGMTGARKFVGEHGYRFPLLFDETRKVTREWGVYRPIGIDGLHIAHPAVFLIDPEQAIRWIAVSPNQYTRPSTAEILEALEAARTSEGIRS